MKLEQNDKSLLFSNTEIPDIFFTEYFSCASGDFLKVYLCFVFLSKYSKEIKLNDLSKKLNLPFPVIQSAIIFWEDLGLITKKVNGYILNDLQEIELHKLYSPKLDLSPEIIEQNSQNQYRAKAIESINNRCFQGIMSPSWYSDINLWFKKYEFDEQVMIALFDYCLNRSALHRNYIQTVADAWFKNKIRTYTDLENYYQRFEQMNIIKKTIAKKLGKTNNLTQFEEAYIEKWITDFGFDLNIINIALKKTTSKANATFDYINKLLSDWYEHDLKSPSEVEQYLLANKSQTKKVSEIQKQANYNNYAQRQYDNLNELYSNKKA